MKRQRLQQHQRRRDAAGARAARGDRPGWQRGGARRACATPWRWRREWPGDRRTGRGRGSRRGRRWPGRRARVRASSCLRARKRISSATPGFWPNRVRNCEQHAAAAGEDQQDQQPARRQRLALPGQPARARRSASAAATVSQGGTCGASGAMTATPVASSHQACAGASGGVLNGVLAMERERGQAGVQVGLAAGRAADVRPAGAGPSRGRRRGRRAPSGSGWTSALSTSHAAAASSQSSQSAARPRRRTAWSAAARRAPSRAAIFQATWRGGSAGWWPRRPAKSSLPRPPRSAGRRCRRAAGQRRRRRPPAADRRGSACRARSRPRRGPGRADRWSRAPTRGRASQPRRVGWQAQAARRSLRRRRCRRSVSARRRAARGGSRGARSPPCRAAADGSARVFAGEHGRRAGRRLMRRPDQVAEGVQDGDDAEPGEQEGQRVAEAEVVVDGAEQHDEQRGGVAEAGARRQHIDAALAEHDRRRLPAGATRSAQRDEALAERGGACACRRHGIAARPRSARCDCRRRRARRVAGRAAGGGRRRRAAPPARPPAAHGRGPSSQRPGARGGEQRQRRRAATGRSASRPTARV